MEFLMGTPQYIRVAGQIYQRRLGETPEFIKHAGWLYRLAKTASENVAAIEALTKLANLSKKIAGAVTDQRIGELMQQAYGEIAALAKKLSSGSYDEKSAALKNWGDLKGGLTDFSAQLEKAKLSKLSGVLKQLVQGADTAIEALKSAEGLGATFSTETSPAEVPSKEGPTVDWGAHAPKKQEQQQQTQASAEPHPVVIDGVQYIPIIQITDEAADWATSTEPRIAAQRTGFHPLAIQLLASGPA
jgi:hypothetical protein